MKELVTNQYHRVRGHLAVSVSANIPKLRTTGAVEIHKTTGYIGMHSKAGGSGVRVDATVAGGRATTEEYVPPADGNGPRAVARRIDREASVGNPGATQLIPKEAEGLLRTAQRLFQRIAKEGYHAWRGSLGAFGPAAELGGVIADS